MPDTSPTPAPEATAAPTDAPTVAPTAAPTISSDKADYAPGEVVTLAGSNWQAGETVQIYVNDSLESTWSRTVDVIADDQGLITDVFALPNWFVATYSVVATGSFSGSAVATFTDAIQTAISLIDSVSPSNVGQAVTFTATVTYFVSGGGHNAGDPVSEGTVVFGEDGNVNCGGSGPGGFIQLQAPTTPNVSGQVTFTTSSLTAGSHLIRACYTGTGGPTGTSSSANALTLVVNACAAPSITTQPTGQSITYGANASFTAAASGTPTPTVQWQVNTGATWSNLAGETSGTLTLTQPPVSQSGNQYRAIFTNSCGGTQSATTSAATLAVTPKSVTITPDSGQSKFYGAADPTLTYTHSALGGSDTDSVFTGALSRVVGENVGTYSITLGTLSAGANYTLVLAATPVAFAITPATLSVNAVANSKTYGDADPALGYTLSGFKFGENATTASVTGSASCSRTAGETVAGSPYTITCTPSNLVADNYLFVTGSTASFTINPAPLTVQADDKTKVVGAPNPALTASFTGFKNGETLATSDVTGTPDLSTVATMASPVGSYPIVVAVGSLASTNYSFVLVDGTLTVLYSTAACLGSPGHTILQPVNDDGSSVFKKGSTVPLKFRVCDANGVSIGTPGVVSSFTLLGRSTGTTPDPTFETIVSTTPDTAFRWSSSDHQWIFNLNTKNLSANFTYFYRITLNDGSNIDFHFGLK
jgi:hypothetical protein